MKIYRVGLAVLFTCIYNLNLFAQIDLTSYRKPTVIQQSIAPQKNLQLNSSDGINIPVGGEIRYLRTGGRNGTGGLELKRAKKIKKHTIARMRLNLKPGASYKVSVWVKFNNVLQGGKPASRTIGCFAVEYFSKNKYLGGTYFTADHLQNGWQRLSKRCDMPNNAVRAVASFYLHPRFEKGTGLYDDLEIAPIKPYSESYMLWPPMNSIKKSGEKVKLKLFSTSPDKAKKLMKSDIIARLTVKGKLYELPVVPGANSIITLQAKGPLATGAGILNLYFTNAASKEILEHHRIPVNILSADIKPPLGHCTFDRYGRALVDGKFFMPIGIFQSNNWDWKEMSYKRQLDELAGTAFNCSLNYFGTCFTMTPKLNGATIQTIRETLDYYHKLGLKSILYLKYNRLTNPLPNTPGHLEIIENFKNHPALLAWYIVDEPELDTLEQVKKWRETVNRLDPFHPTYIVQYKLLGRTAATSDVIGGDHYPVGDASDGKTHNMFGIISHGKSLRATGRPMWTVPQIFNWGVYRAKNAQEFKQYDEPSVEQMRGMFLQIANEGARGFIMYSHHDLYRKSSTRKSYERRWKDVKEVAQMLKDNERFIMSSKGPLPVKNLKINAGVVSAKKYITDTGNEVRVFVTGVTASSNRAIIIVKAPKQLKSRYGLCKPLGNNKFEFTGKGICGDVLY